MERNIVLKMMQTITIKKILLFLAVVSLTACDKSDQPEDILKTGNLRINFLHYCEGKAIDFDIRKYVNEAGNEYMVNEIQYFISDVHLSSATIKYVIDDWKDIHYVDTDIPSTREWKIYDAIPAGEYNSISFTFGISGEKNQSLMFSDPPESLMFWPEYLGGGYHYLKLNGKWLDTNQFERPFNFHLGIGQEYDPETGDITGFVQNYFEVEVIGSSVSIAPDDETVIDIIMHVDRWFSNPHTYDHNYWGGDIMQKQEAMHVACENGWNVFEVKGDRK